MKRNLAASKKALHFGVSGAVGAFFGNAIAEPFLHFDRLARQSFFDNVRGTTLWFGIVGAGIATAILFAYYYYIKGRPQIQQALKKGGLFGFIAGAISGAIAETIYSGIGPNELLRVICWGIAGSLLGLALSKRIPNLGTLRGMGGGTAGGVLGGCLFIAFAYTFSGTVGRLIGCAAIGFCIGIMLIVVETLFSKAWLIINYDNGETRTLNIGSEPITMGSDDYLSIIYVPNVLPVAFRFKMESGKILCEDVASGRITYLQPGDEKRLGNCTVTVGISDLNSQTTLKSSPALPSPNAIANSFVGSQFLLKVGGRIIPLSQGVQLFTSDLPSLTSASSNSAVAQVNSHPEESSKLGLKNLSEQTWWVTEENGDIKLVEPRSTLTLTTGTKIELGSINAEIISNPLP
ncbi:MAG TPA: hypothetical protein VK211_06425 [Kamptonema sp.]|nr:hypothetical protein [Kamptonema sp.]